VAPSGYYAWLQKPDSDRGNVGEYFDSNNRNGISRRPMNQVFAVVIDEERLELTASGTLFGLCGVCIAGKALPDSDWTDFVVPVITWWISGVVSTNHGVGEAHLDFMDGPFGISVVPIDHVRVSLTAFERRKAGAVTALGRVVLPIADLRRDVVVAATSVGETCLRKGWKSPAIDELGSAIRLVM